MADSAPQHRKTPPNNNSFPTNRIRSLLRARYYDPHSAEFLFPDPLEYVDGMSLFRGYFVGVGVDPKGTITITNSGSEHPAQCGQRHYMRWTFTLHSDAPCDGFLIQQVEVKCNVNHCADCCDCPRSLPDTPSIVYWEAWEYRKGERLDVDYENYDFTDEARYTPESNTCGIYSQLGIVRFYCKDADDVPVGKTRIGTGDLSTNWQPGSYGDGDCQTTTGDLVSTDKLPDFWRFQPIEGPAARSWGIVWNCCPDCHNFVSANGSP